MFTEKETAAGTAAIVLPEDQYAHPGAPTEWWWHVGTLTAKDGSTYGFEVNAAMIGSTFTQIAISDVKTGNYYQKVNFLGAPAAGWAESDPTKPWAVTLGTSGSGAGYIAMTAINGDPLNMSVKADFSDQLTATTCAIDLTFKQQGAPLLVWGTGCHKDVDPNGTTPLTKDNFYYSLTHLAASGTLTIGNDTIEVTGITWMDHEYGAFPKSYKWIFHNVQITDGISFSNFTKPDQVPQAGIPMMSQATLLMPDGTSTLVNTTTTPIEPVFTFDNVDYFEGFRIELNSGNLYGIFEIRSLVKNQVFVSPVPNSNVFEGIGECIGIFNGEKVAGTAWIEENLAPTIQP